MFNQVIHSFKSTFLAGVVAAACALPGVLYAGNVSFAYQGKVKVQGQAYTGTGQFKLAVVNAAGSTTLWSHDGTSQAGGEPTGTPLSVPVNDGIFNITVGDTTAGHQPINPTVFAPDTPLKLRVWFDGGQGFQQLTPDQNLNNVTLNVSQTGTEDFTVYVNGATGNDSANGLTPATAKQTIQAAVDSLPDRLKCNVTIDIADGVYREQVEMHGFSARHGNTLTLRGDENWTSASAANLPTVKISGADTGNVPVRDFGVFGNQCVQVVFHGIHFVDTVQAGIRLDNGSYTLINCVASNAQKWAGFQVTRHCDVQLSGCLALNNPGQGYWISTSSFAQMTNCGARGNTGSGLLAQVNTQVNLLDSGDYSNNTGSGIEAWDSYVGCNIPCYLVLKNNGTAANNAAYVTLHYQAQLSAFDINKNAGRFQISGNRNSNQPAVFTGSNIWW